MKKHASTLGIVSLLILLLCVGCKKDDKDNDPGDHFKYNNVTYPLADGILEYWGQWSGTGYNFDVTLYSSGINFNGDDFSGTGNIVYLEMYSSSSTSLTAGTYTFDSGESEDPFSFDEGLFAMAFNIDLETGTVVAVASGTVKVSKDGSAYVFTFNCMDQGSKAITGTFKGTLDYFDYSKKKSSHKRSLL